MSQSSELASSSGALSRTISHALRHAPWLYELELDEEGWVEVDALLSALRGQKTEWRELAEQDIVRVMDVANKRRFELLGGRVRALYGHSTPRRLLKVSAEPPMILYHGTSPQTCELILLEGLRPMGRQYVHLSEDLEVAHQVGRRKSKDPVILEIVAFKAHVAGVVFYVGNEQIWLADLVPQNYVRVLLPGEGGR